MLGWLGGSRGQRRMHDGLERGRGEIVECGEVVHGYSGEVGKFWVLEGIVPSVRKTEKTHCQRIE